MPMRTASSTLISIPEVPAAMLDGEHEINTAWQQFRQSAITANQNGFEFGCVCRDWRDRYRKQGSRKGEGFEAVLEKLKIPKTSAYRWITRYEEKHGLRTTWHEVENQTRKDSEPCQRKNPTEPVSEVAASSCHVAENLPEEAEVGEPEEQTSNYEPDGKRPVRVQLMLTSTEEAEWEKAIDRLRTDEEDLLTTVIFEAVVDAARQRVPMLEAEVVQ